MANDKKDSTTQDARTGPDADKNREELKRRAEKGIRDAKGDMPKDEV